MANDIENLVTNALKQLVTRDEYLLKNDLNECTINHKLACHLEAEFPGWQVDCEYNKDADIAKGLDLPKDKIDWNDTEAKSVFPDIIIHCRGGNGPNLLVIEVKKSSNKANRNHDYNKLIEYVNKLHYNSALFLKIGTKSDTGKWTLDWIRKEDFNHEA
jgi:hypothetical protein